jgi:hypothetical protein
VQVLDAFGPRLFGVQLREVGVVSVAPPVTTPPEEKTTIPLPDVDDPELLLIPIEVVVTPADITRLIVATVPF